MTLSDRVRKIEEAYRKLERFMEVYESLLENNAMDDLEYIMSLLEEGIEE